MVSTEAIPVERIKKKFIDVGEKCGNILHPVQEFLFIILVVKFIFTCFDLESY